MASQAPMASSQASITFGAQGGGIKLRKMNARKMNAKKIQSNTYFIRFVRKRTTYMINTDQLWHMFLNSIAL